jgi:hypothetical protein
VAHLDEIEISGEFRRADSAPRFSIINGVSTPTWGNGLLSVADWVQAGRYAAGLDTVVPGAGPLASASTASAEPRAVRSTAQNGRTLRIPNLTVEPGQVLTIPVLVDSKGDENAFGFSVAFDSAVLQFKGAVLSGPAAGAALLINKNRAEDGNLGVAIGLPIGQTLSSGTHTILELQFEVSEEFTESKTAVQFADSPVRREVVGAAADELTGAYVGGLVSRGPAVTLGRNPDGSIQLQIQGEAGKHYVLEVSPDLLTWTQVKEITLAAGAVGFSDADAPKFTGRFYRLRPIP